MLEKSLGALLPAVITILPARETASALFLSTMASLITMSAFIWFLL